MLTRTGGLAFMRRGLAAAGVMLIASACGGSMSLTEYAEEVETLVTELGTQVAALDAEREARGPSVEGEVEYWGSRAAARKQFHDGLNELEPPSELADMHELAVDIMLRFTVAEEALAAKARDLEDLAGIASLWASAEIRAWQAVDEESRVICVVAQRELDETEQRSDLEDLPWIPGEMKETVQVAFGCTQ